MISGGNRLDPFGPEVAEIFERVDATMSVEELDHRFGHRTVVKRVASISSNLAKRIGQCRVLEQIAGLRRLGPDHIRLFVARLVKELLCDPPVRVTLGKRESVLCVVNGWGEQLPEGQSAEAGTHGIPSGNCSWDVDGFNTDGVNGGNAFGREVFDRQGFGSPAARVKAVEFASLGLVVEDEEVYTDAVDVGLDNTHHSIGRDGRVDGVTTLFENMCAGLRGKKLGGGDDAEFRDDHRTALSWNRRKLLRQNGHRSKEQHD